MENVGVTDQIDAVKVGDRPDRHIFYAADTKAETLLYIDAHGRVDLLLVKSLSRMLETHTWKHIEWCFMGTARSDITHYRTALLPLNCLRRVPGDGSHG